MRAFGRLHEAVQKEIRLAKVALILLASFQEPRIVFQTREIEIETVLK